MGGVSHLEDILDICALLVCVLGDVDGEFILEGVGAQ